MPVYEYQCSKCGHVTEAVRTMSAADEALPCEKCGSKTTRQHSIFQAAAGKSSSSSSLPSGGGGGCGPGCGCHMH
ncbi:MAG: zinc ribbon domain-containing protein [Phycisphaeraceae bacterium]|nr:zinc ribbon domain-containing protein [Phycisphaeraceae bacterium]